MHYKYGKQEVQTCHEGREERRTFREGIEHSRDVLPLQPDAGQCDRRSWLASCQCQTLSFYTQKHPYSSTDELASNEGEGGRWFRPAQAK